MQICIFLCLTLIFTSGIIFCCELKCLFSCSALPVVLRIFSLLGTNIRYIFFLFGRIECLSLKGLYSCLIFSIHLKELSIQFVLSISFCNRTSTWTICMFVFSCLLHAVLIGFHITPHIFFLQRNKWDFFVFLCMGIATSFLGAAVGFHSKDICKQNFLFQISWRIY